MKLRLPRPAWLRRAEARLRPLDRLPRRAALGIGAAAGTAAGLGFAWSGEPWGLAGGVAVLGLAGWLAASAEAVVEQEPPGPQKEPPKGALSDALGMVWLPGGAFEMGSAWYHRRADSDERPRHKVTVEPFWIAAYSVRQSLYRAVVGENPGRPEGDDLPVNGVTWYEAVRFCNALSAKEGLTPAYRIGEGSEPQVEWDREADGFRLPAEAEWEYACRAGTTAPWSFGDDEGRIGEYAWFAGNSQARPHPVGERLPNPWGLYDMHGNVWEWCWDVYGPYEKPSPTGGGRVLRGGSFWFHPGLLRSAFRDRLGPGARDFNIGFRCVRGSVRQP